MEAPDAVEFALFLHDCVYEPGASDNEARSARIASMFLGSLGTVAPIADSVLRLVQVTDHRTSPRHPDDELIVDIDMAILGAPGPEYDAYAAAIRTEFTHVPPDRYSTGRTQFLESTRARPSIFRTAHFRHRFEAQARANIDREIGWLSKAI